VILVYIIDRRKCDKDPGFINTNAVFKKITNQVSCVVGHVLISAYNYRSDLNGRTKWEDGSEEGNYGKLDNGLSNGKSDDINYIFRVCKSVHHHTFKRINQPDAATSQVYYLSFKYSST
jgi:hypothetical protein